MPRGSNNSSALALGGPNIFAPVPRPKGEADTRSARSTGIFDESAACATPIVAHHRPSGRAFSTRPAALLVLAVGAAAVTSLVALGLRTGSDRALRPPPQPAPASQPLRPTSKPEPARAEPRRAPHRIDQGSRPRRRRRAAQTAPRHTRPPMPSPTSRPPVRPPAVRSLPARPAPQAPQPEAVPPDAPPEFM